VFSDDSSLVIVLKFAPSGGARNYVYGGLVEEFQKYEN
jgi:hypothetical protein